VKVLKFRRKTPDGPSPADVAANFCPGRQKRARHLLMLSRSEVADRTGITPIRLLHFETAVAKPRAYEVEKLAEALSVPVGFFAAGRPMALLDTSDVFMCGSRRGTPP
jgi:transcriptional regulator with XRE-family HTH domain